MAKANQQMQAANQPTAYGQPQQSKDPETRAMNRCISSGRLPASCTGNALLGHFTSMITQLLPGADKQATPRPNMAGVYEGAGNWRLDFSVDGGVLVNCSFLAPNQENYKIEFRSDRTVIVIDTTPKPLIVTLRDSNTIVGPPARSLSTE